MFVLLFIFGYAGFSKILLTEVDRLIRETENKSSIKYLEMIDLKKKESLSPKHLINIFKTVSKWEKIEKNSNSSI